MPGSVGRGGASWAVLLAVAGPALAQTPPPPPTPPAITVPLPPPQPALPAAQPLPPPQPGPPLIPAPAPVTPPPQPGPPLIPAPAPVTPPLLEVPPGVLTSASPAGVSAAGLATRPVDLRPLPGSLQDQLDQEYAARAAFRYCTWRGTTITGFPNSLLWQPPFGIKREPRLMASPTTLDNFRESWTLDTSIGTTVGMWRVEPIGQDTAYQFDIFGVVHTRLTPRDVAVTDYRFGFPLTARRGPWHFKLAYEHTSSHLADELLRAQLPFRVDNYDRDELVFGVGRWFAERVRTYGQVAYAFAQTYPFPESDDFRWRFDAGFEWYCPLPTGWRGTPFLAVNVDSRGDAAFQPGVTAQAGWLWRNPFQRLANARLFVEYYNGRSPYGQFYLDREEFYAFGISCDY
jgi:hypothetical protein